MEAISEVLVKPFEFFCKIDDIVPIQFEFWDIIQIVALANFRQHRFLPLLFFAKNSRGVFQIQGICFSILRCRVNSRP
ncbi:MAG: hypothetical protein VR65_27475 [Desulfobulbaceae bacterium BRH_c16a]|nr:MAG: hypothetical protein VR65_27475 [Desulfobulbaceae bacterium BRH_c16a]